MFAVTILLSTKYFKLHENAQFDLDLPLVFNQIMLSMNNWEYNLLYEKWAKTSIKGGEARTLNVTAAHSLNSKLKSLIKLWFYNARSLKSGTCNDFIKTF